MTVAVHIAIDPRCGRKIQTHILASTNRVGIELSYEAGKTPKRCAHTAFARDASAQTEALQQERTARFTAIADNVPHYCIIIIQDWKSFFRQLRLPSGAGSPLL